MALSIYDYVTAKEQASYWVELAQYREPYLGESKFPNKKQLGLDISYIKGAKKAPVQLMLSAFDAKVIPISRQGFEQVKGEMPYFKNSMKVDERLRQELNKVLASGNEEAIKVIVGEIFNDNKTLLENAALTREIMRMQALTTGAISLSNNGQVFSFDYHMPTENKKTVDWTQSDSADPITDIVGWQDYIEQTSGIRPNELLMNAVTFSYIQKADAVKKAIYAISNGAVVPSRQAVANYILENTGCTVYIYNKGWDKEGVFTKFVADGTVVLMPEGLLGNTYMGTTPEESDLMSGSDAEVVIVDDGVALATYKDKDPVTVVTKAAELVLPSFERADCVLIADVDGE